MPDAPSRNIPLASVSIGSEEEEAMRTALHSGQLTHGEKNHEFESAFAEKIGVRNAVSVNSCASALLVALVANDITGEVILPSFTFTASANAVIAAGATPVFVDVEYGTGNIDPERVREAISENTGVVMPVHFGGQMARMEELSQLCEDHGLVLIEDSAEAIGATYNGKQAGSFGIGCFSFFPTKNIITGEGGMITTNDDEFARRVRLWIAHGIEKQDNPPHPGYRDACVPGYNLRMSNILAALGVEQMKKLSHFNNARRSLVGVYNTHLESLSEVTVPYETEQCRHVYQMYTIKVDSADRTPLVYYLQERGVGASVHFNPPVHKQTYYHDKGFRNSGLETTEQLAEEILTLPMYPDLTENEVQYVCECIHDYYANRT
jgi:perosamine synthetase